MFVQIVTLKRKVYKIKLKKNVMYHKSEGCFSFKIELRVVGRKCRNAC